MDKEKKRNVVSWVVLGLIALAFLADGWLVCFAVPSEIKLINDFNLTLPAPMVFAVTVSHFFTNIINLLIMFPLFSITAIALVLKEIFVKTFRVRLGINLGVLFILLVLFCVVGVGLLLTMIKISDSLAPS